MHGFSRKFTPSTAPFRAFLAAAKDGELTSAEADAATDDRLLAEYRRGRACHPLLPYRDWAGCRSAIDRLGAVIVAGCRDAQAARSLGFVPSHGMGAALTMARGRAPADARIGFLVAPPYPPLLVGGEQGEAGQPSPR